MSKKLATCDQKYAPIYDKFFFALPSICAIALSPALFPPLRSCVAAAAVAAGCWLDV